MSRVKSVSWIFKEKVVLKYCYSLSNNNFKWNLSCFCFLVYIPLLFNVLSLISDTKVLRYYFNMGLQVSAFKMSIELLIETAGFPDKCTDVFKTSSVLNVHFGHWTTNIDGLSLWRLKPGSGSEVLPQKVEYTILIVLLGVVVGF